MSKIAPEVLDTAITNILTRNYTIKKDPKTGELKGAINQQKRKDKPRPFVESIDLQVNLKNYDTSKDKRFAGTLRLPNICRPNMKVCVISDLQQMDACKKAGIDTKTMEELKKLNKVKKLVKKMCNEYDAFLASDSIIKTIPKVVGPHMNRLNKFPTAVALGDDIKEKADDVRATIKFQLKKVLCLGCCIGHVQMDQQAIRQNTMLAVNYFVSLLKKNWQNLKSAYLKSTMGQPQKLYP